MFSCDLQLNWVANCFSFGNPKVEVSKTAPNICNKFFHVAMFSVSSTFFYCYYSKLQYSNNENNCKTDVQLNKNCCYFKMKIANAGCVPQN